MKKSLILLSLATAFAVSSCRKDIEQKKDNPSPTVSNMNDLVVPAGFTWETSRDVNFTVAVTDDRFQGAVHVISIYDGAPYDGGILLSRGSATLNESFVSKFYLANTVKKVFVVKTSPDNSEIIQEVEVAGADVNVSIGSKGLLGKTTLGKAAGPDCNSGCTQTITSNNTNLNVNNGDVICITGNNITVGFNANGGTVRICGTNVSVQNASLNNNATLIVTSTGTATFSNLNLNGSSTTFQNYGTTTVSGSFSPGGSFTNEGTLTTTGDFNLNSGSTHTNSGTINVGATMNVNTSNTTTNSGTIITASHFQLNSSAVFVNNCYLWVKGNYNNNNIMRNYSLIKVNLQTTINSSSEIGLYNGAMIKTADMMINGTLKGYNSTSLAKVSGNTTINSSGSIRNAIQYCDANGIETNNGTITGGAALGCTLYIAVTSCNPEGNGTPPIVDADNDGVADSQDEYPTDPTKAYNNYYPSASGSATVAFEDMWPYKGDYDMNDVVMTYRYNVITNAQNKVVLVSGNFTLHATGGSFQNGFGVEFPIERAKASGLTGGTLEAGQNKAVVTLFDNMRNQMNYWNTKPSDPASDTVNYNISFNVTDGPTLSAFGLSSYNPFIWNNTTGFGRGYEIHLPGKTPTTLANTGIYGTGDDNSNTGAGRYYVSKNNSLPWAINIPVKFNYPVEKADINVAYLKFASWVQSNGSQYADWYTSQTGYRNAANIYTRP